MEATLYSGHETLEVVGESHHQEALWRIVGGHQADPVRCEIYAVLVPDPANHYDRNAIEVRINGMLVGYLSREDAAVYGPGLLGLMETSANQLVALHGVIVGGGLRPDGVGYLGVFLDHDPADFGLVPHHTSHGLLRTGLSEAIATDFEDESYDLSWYQQLSENDARSIEQLRSFLDAERDPIDRHPRGATVATSTQAANVETLVCALCGRSFERARTRGRKPKTCTTCRSLTTPAAPM